MKNLDKENINTIDYWNNFYSKRETEAIRKKRLYFYQEIKELLDNKKEHSLLEIGCGTGYGLNYLSTILTEYKMSGIDLSDEAINMGKKLFPNLSLNSMNILEQDIDKNYDFIIIIQTLEHFINPENIVNKLLKKCEKLIISVPYEKYLRKDEAHVSSGFTEDSFREYGVIFSSVKNHGKHQYLFITLKGKHETNL